MSDMKCPFCQQEMICGDTICHYNPDCPIHDCFVPTEVLELLDRTRKALDTAIESLNDIANLDDGSTVYNSEQFLWTKAYATSALEQIVEETEK